MFQLLSVPAIKSSIRRQIKKEMLKTNKDYCKTYQEKKGEEYSKKEIRARKKEVFRPKKAR